MTFQTILSVVMDEKGHFDVVLPDGSCCDGLSWDEMLGQVARLTMNDRSRSFTYAMHTPEQWEQMRADRQTRLDAMIDVKTQDGAAQTATPFQQMDQYMRDLEGQRDELLVSATDFLQVLSESGLLCECGEPDCRTTRLRAALAKAGAA